MILAVTALLAVLGGGEADAARAHPAAFSRLIVRVADDALRLELRVQELTLREVPLWWLDTDGDVHYSTLEIEAAWPQIAGLLDETLWLELDGERLRPHWRILAFEELGEAGTGGGSRFEWLALEASFPRPSDPRALAVHSDLFFEHGNPEHRLHVLVEGVWQEPAQTLLDYAVRDWRFEFPSTGGVLRSYFLLGFEHVLIGWDHLAFLAALLLGVARFGGLLGAVTAFTLAHSLTLALTAFGRLRLPDGLVEPAIAWSVLVVALLHLRLGPGRSRAWMPAFGFGLLHGCGFAGVLGEIGLPRTAEATGLLGFNLGVEAGQLAFVLPLVVLAAAGRRLLPAGWPAIRAGAGLAVVAFALHLTGNSMLEWWIRLPEALPAGWTALLLGTAAAAAVAGALALLTRPAADAPRPSSLIVQSAVLVACYLAGSWLAGLRG